MVDPPCICPPSPQHPSDCQDEPLSHKRPQPAHYIRAPPTCGLVSSRILKGPSIGAPPKLRDACRRWTRRRHKILPTPSLPVCIRSCQSLFLRRKRLRSQSQTTSEAPSYFQHKVSPARINSPLATDITHLHESDQINGATFVSQPQEFRDQQDGRPYG